MKLIVSLLAEAGRYHAGQPYLNAAAVIMIDVVPLGVLLRSAWGAFRVLVFDDTERSWGARNEPSAPLTTRKYKTRQIQNHRQLDASILLSEDKNMTIITSHCNAQRLVIALLTHHYNSICKPHLRTRILELHSDIMKIWSLFSTLRKFESSCYECRDEMVQNSKALCEMSNIITNLPLDGLLENGERIYIV